MTNAPATREAMIVRADDKTPVVTFDPMDIEVLAGGLANAWDAKVMDMLDATIEWELADMNAPTLVLVWSDTREIIRFTCPMCDDFCTVDDAAIEDMPNGSCALVCATCLDGDVD